MHADAPVPDPAPPSIRRSRPLPYRGHQFSRAPFARIASPPPSPAGGGDVGPSHRRIGNVGLYDRMRGRIIFPVHDEHGTPVGFAGRLLTGDGPKYLNTPETELFLANGWDTGTDVTAYRSDMRHFTDWCRRHGFPSLPTSSRASRATRFRRATLRNRPVSIVVPRGSSPCR